MTSSGIQNARDFILDEIKKYLKFFLIMVALVFVGMQLVPVFFEKGIKAEPADTPFSENAGLNENFIQAVSPEQEQYISESAKISIPKLAVEAPILFVKSTNPDDFKAPLKQGVTHYPSAYPGQRGRAIILGHSAPKNWPKINYDWVFSELNSLEIGDEIIISSDVKQFRYVVKQKIFLDKGEEMPAENIGGASEIALISCWPPGIDYKRIVVLGELTN